jgi:hypothetical protein
VADAGTEPQHIEKEDGRSFPVRHQSMRIDLRPTISNTATRSSSTDSPDSGRSCFQAIDLDEYTCDGVPNLVDLHEIRDLGIVKPRVEKYERLLKHMFGAMWEERELRKPAVKVLPRAG